MGERPTEEQAFRPRLNHVAVSMDPKLLEAEGRTAILDFYGSVFGWTEGDNTGEVGNPLILYTGEFAQFVYLLPAEDHLVCPRLDHFGLQVSTRRELEDIVDRATEYAESDDRVDVIGIESRTTSGPTHDFTLTSAYVGYVIPLMVEIQHLERRENCDRRAALSSSPPARDR